MHSILEGALALILAGMHAPHDFHYRIIAVDSASEVGAATVVTVDSVWITVSVVDSTQGQRVHALVDSARRYVDGVATQSTLSTGSAHVDWCLVEGRLTGEITPSARVPDIAAIASDVQWLFVAMPPGAASGTKWTDTARSTLPTATATSEIVTTRSWELVSSGDTNADIRVAIGGRFNTTTRNGSSIGGTSTGTALILYPLAGPARSVSVRSFTQATIDIRSAPKAVHIDRSNTVKVERMP